MDCFALLLLLATIAATPPREHDPHATFPTKSRNWELADAVAELRDPRSTLLERQVARERLAQLGTFALPALRRVAVLDVSWEVRELAISAIADIRAFPGHPDAAADLGGMTFTLDGVAAQLRTFLVQGRSDLLEEALQWNIDLLERGLGVDRQNAANRLACIRPFASPALPALVRALNDPDSAVSNAAADAICAEGGSAPVEWLVTMLDDRDGAIRIGAMRGLLRFAPHDPRFTEVMHPARTHESLLGNLRSPYPERRTEAAAYLSQNHIIPPPVAAALLRAVQSGDFVAREGLVLGIERAWADGGEVEAVLQTIQDDDPDTTNRAFASAARRAITSIRPD
jgi:hypothetical protein